MTKKLDGGDGISFGGLAFSGRPLGHEKALLEERVAGEFA